MSGVLGEGSDIAEFFNGKSVFITGATGFLGKAVVEKLLRCCPGVNNIYVLVRAKRGTPSVSRLDGLVNCALFNKLTAERPGALSKIHIVNGDITLPNLGISTEDDQILCENVSVVIHSAATVKFDEPLKKSIQINVEGTRKVILLAKRMKNIEAVVHVSTAYSNCDRSEINEEIYPINMDPNHAIDTFNWLPEDVIEAMTPKLIGNKPNTYTYTKHLAEQLVTQYKDDVPIAIVRPSIVAATYDDPIPGWVDNWNGPTGIFIGCGKGFLRTLLLHTDQKLDIIPLDHVVNLIIAAAWRTGTARKRKEEASLVYHCCSGAENPFYLTQAIPWCFDAFWQTPFDGVLWFPGPIVTTSLMANNIMDRLFHYIPCQMMDLKAKLCGEKAIMMRIYAKAQAGILALRYFCTNEWNFSRENTNSLYALLSESDRSTFKFDIKEVSWEHYLHGYVYGMRKYVLKEPDSTIPRAVKGLRRMHNIHRGTVAIFYSLLVMALFYIISFVVNRVTA